MYTIVTTVSNFMRAYLPSSLAFSGSKKSNMKESFYKKTSASWLGKMSLMVIALLFAGMANGAAVSWTGNAGDNNWATAGNWTGGSGVPATGDAVTISISTTTTINNVPTLSIASLTLSPASGSQTLTFGGTFGTLTVTGDMTISQNLTVDDGGNTFAVGGNLVGGGTINTNTTKATGRIQLTTLAGGKNIGTVGQTLKVGNLELLNTSGTNTALGTLTIQDNLTVTSGGTFADGGFFITVGGNIYNLSTTGTASFTGLGKFIMTGTSTISGITSVSITTGGTGYTVSQTTLAVTFSAPNTSGGVTATGYASTNSSGVITGFVITNPGSGYTSTPSIATINGSASLGVGNYTVNRNASTAKTILASGTTTNGNTTTISFGNLELNSANADLTIAAITTVQVKGLLNFNSTNNTTGKLIFAASNSNLTLGNGSAYNGSAASISMNGTGSGNVIRAFGTNTGGLTINSTGAVGTFYFDATNYKFNNFTFTAGTATFATQSSWNSNPSINGGTLTTGTGANISFLANTLTLGGGLLVLGTNSTMLVGNTSIVASTSTAGKGVDASASGAGVTFYGAAASYTLGQYFFANTNVTNFTDSLNSSSQATVFSLNASAAIINVTNFKFANGNTQGLTFTSNGRMTVGTAATTGSVTIQKINTGGLTLTTVPTYTTASGQSYNNVSFTYSGTSPITTGSELPSTIKDLTLTNTGATPSVTLTTSTTVNGTMTLSGGNTGAASNSMLGINDGITLTMAGGSLIKRTSQNCIISKTGTTGSVAYGGLVDFTYTGGTTFSQTSLEIPSGTSNLGTFTIPSGASTYTLPTGPVTYTINTAANFTGTGGIALNGNTVVMANGSTITRGSSVGVTSTNSFFTGTGTVKYGTAANHRVNLTIDYTTNTAGAELQIAGTGSGGSIGTLTVQNGAVYTLVSATKNISVDALVIGAGSTLDMSTNQLQENTANGTTVSINATGVLKSSYILAAAIFPTASTLKTYGGTVNYAASGMQVAGGTYNNLTLGGSETAAGNITVNGTFTTPSSASTLTMGTNTLLGSTSTTTINCTVTTSNTSSTPFSRVKHGLVQLLSVVLELHKQFLVVLIVP